MAAALAAAALAASGPAFGQDGPRIVNVLDPPADLPVFVDRPALSAFAAAYPKAAAAVGMSGHAVLH